MVERLLFRLFVLALQATLLVSPRPAAFALRRLFAASGAQMAKSLEKHAPQGIESLINERYGDAAEEVMDVYWPSSATEPLPVLMWVHGGGFLGGTKDELGSYFKLLASNGFTVVAPNYALAPENRYPTPVRQVMAALRHVQENAARYHADVRRFALAGDSAGAHISAQIAAIVTTPGYSDALGISPTIDPARLRAVVLCCGPFDMALAKESTDPVGDMMLKTFLWAYSGVRNAADAPSFATASVSAYVGPAFPPALITVGNADPLRTHSEVMLKQLRAAGRNPDTVLFPPDYQPALDHEYQFNLDTKEGQMFFGRMTDFLERWLRPI